MSGLDIALIGFVILFMLVALFSALAAIFFVAHLYYEVRENTK